MQTDQWRNYSQSNRTIAFINEQKRLATAHSFQEPNHKYETWHWNGNIMLPWL